MKFIECNKVYYKYTKENSDSKENAELDNNTKETYAVSDVDFNVAEGEFIAVLGHNGSGKSTFAKLLNGIFKPSLGSVFVCGLNSSEEENIWNIRKNVGMVFQNPDNQIVATVVKEDVAFGVENIGIESDEIIKRVKDALESVDMLQYAEKAPHMLSGGQKQRVAVAGILAMKPKCIIFDESTAMLDPIGRKKIMDIIMNLNKKEKITIILITHFMEEALFADKVIAMEKGRVVRKGTPIEFFSDASAIKKLGLDLPVGANIADKLRKFGMTINQNIIYDDDLVDFILKKGLKNITYTKNETKQKFQEKIIQVKNISYVYNEKSVFENNALKNISFDIFKGEIVSIIGKTGSGKSTLVQTLNGLIKPNCGEIIVDGKNILEKNVDMKSIRKKVGIVFQYPEYQLFEETVFKDAMFGPLNMGFSQKEAEEKVINAFDAVGIGSEFFEKSPFELSGGQKRRIAIAGVIAMEPNVLILDEPTAALDPIGRDEILSYIKNMRDKFNMTIVMVSHSMEEVCKISDRIIVMNDGNIMLCGNCENVFSNRDIIKSSGINPPVVNLLFEKLSEKGLSVPNNIYTVSDAVSFLKERL